MGSHHIRSQRFIGRVQVSMHALAKHGAGMANHGSFDHTGNGHQDVFHFN
jgi:hypothetical protein